MKKFIDIPNVKFAEIFQSNKIQFAYVKETKDAYTQLHGKIDCRDFLADVLHAEETDEPFEIWGFKWDPEVKQIDRDATKLVMFFNKESQLEKLKQNLHKIHELESTWKLRKTRIITINKTTAIIIGSRFYLRKGFAISLYTFLLKAFAITDKFKSLTGNELKYYEQCGSNFTKLINNFRKVLKRTGSMSGVTHDSNSIIHDKAGFVSVCTNNRNIYGVYLASL